MRHSYQWCGSLIGANAFAFGVFTILVGCKAAIKAPAQQTVEKCNNGLTAVGRDFRHCYLQVKFIQRQLSASSDENWNDLHWAQSGHPFQCPHKAAPSDEALFRT